MLKFKVKTFKLLIAIVIVSLIAIIAGIASVTIKESPTCATYNMGFKNTFKHVISQNLAGALENMRFQKIINNTEEISWESKSTKVIWYWTSPVDIALPDLTHVDPLKIPSIIERSRKEKNVKLSEVDQKVSSSTLTVCTLDKRSRDWQKVAHNIEKTLQDFVLFKRAYISKDPEIYKCYENCSFDTQVPIDFENLNRDALAFP